MNTLLKLAILPVIILCDYIYKKDVHKEPAKLLFKIFLWGIGISIPIVIVEMLLGTIFDTDTGTLPFILIFINTFFGIGLIEEGFKWIVTKRFGYNNREFDEIYDVIVYSVFASLGFSCIENIIYVLGSGFTTGILRAFLSIPGHTCFGVLMGYYMGKAKVNEINNQIGLKRKNLLFSLFVPSLFHTMYDALLISNNQYCIVLFFAFDIFMVIYCFGIVKRMSNIQQNIISNVENGNIVENEDGNIICKTDNMINALDNTKTNICPICNHSVNILNNYCSNCGFSMKENK